MSAIKRLSLNISPKNHDLHRSCRRGSRDGDSGGSRIGSSFGLLARKRDGNERTTLLLVDPMAAISNSELHAAYYGECYQAMSFTRKSCIKRVAISNTEVIFLYISTSRVALTQKEWISRKCTRNVCSTTPEWLFPTNTIRVDFDIIKNSLETSLFWTASIDSHMEHSIQGQLQSGNAQLLPSLSSVLSAVNLKVLLHMLDHELHIDLFLRERLRSPVRIAQIGDYRSKIVRGIRLMFNGALNPKILCEVDHQSRLIKLVIGMILHMGFQHKIARSVRPQAVSVVVTESIVCALPKITSGIWNNDDLVTLDAVLRWLTKPGETLWNRSVNLNHRHPNRNKIKMKKRTGILEFSRFDMSDITLIKEKAEEYIQWDPVESTREEIRKLLTEEKWDELRNLILNRLAFGTAGSC